ncbi:uncharacterized protein LOC127162094 [Labeo rohita]|uniref:uncharacterized protein LOC127162094 n=1 Tax=Labeo rohita TaxID=84645 RepID=UPI0021E322AC|nr:uncharacterized protein LOC127162094 [Labeo rohita]
MEQLEVEVNKSSLKKKKKMQVEKQKSSCKENILSVKQIIIHSDISKNSSSSLQINFRSETMRTSCVWVFELVLLMVWTSETQTTAQASPISERVSTSVGQFCVKPDTAWKNVLETHNVTGLTNTLPIPENNPPLSPETPTSRPKDTQHPAQGHPPSDPRTPTSRPKDTHLPAQGHPPHGPRTPTSRPKDTHLPVQRLPPPDPRTPSSRSKDTHLPAKGQPPPGQRTATSHRLKDRDYLGWMDFG